MERAVFLRSGIPEASPKTGKVWQKPALRESSFKRGAERLFCSYLNRFGTP